MTKAVVCRDCSMPLLAWTMFALACSQEQVFAHYPVLTFAEVAQTADIVFVGTVSGETCWANDRMVYTDVAFDVQTLVRVSEHSQQGRSQRIRLTIPGGTCNGETVVIAGNPKLVVGETYCVFAHDDGLIYANPIVGGDQGLFSMVLDSTTGRQCVVTQAGQAVVGLMGPDLLLSDATVDAGAGGSNMSRRQSALGTAMAAPSSDDPFSFAEARRCSSKTAEATALGDFIEQIIPRALGERVTKRLSFAIGRESALRRGDGRGMHEVQDVADPEGGIQVGLEGESLPAVPMAQAGSPENAPAPHGYGRKGGQMGACGWRSLPLVMEQVPSDWWSYRINNDCMATWNYVMEIFRYRDSDGVVGHNGQSEFCGWFGDETLRNVYGFEWGGALAKTVIWSIDCECCEILETDVVFNPAYKWTDNDDYAIHSNDVFSYRSVCMHELGHTWGEMSGRYAETYDYDVPSVMHKYWRSIVEDGWGVHAMDAYLLRRIYDEQRPVLGTVDLGVESYHAQDGLRTAAADKGMYEAGDPIVLSGITVENMTASPLHDVRLRLFLSQSRASTWGGYPLGTFWYWTDFNAESRSSFDIQSVVPGYVPAGQYWIHAYVTSRGENYARDDYPWNDATHFFKPITVTATSTLTSRADPPEGGIVSPAGSLTFPRGTVVQLCATASPGWRFSHWGGDAQGSGRCTTVLLDWRQETAVACFVTAQRSFRRGDVNGDGKIDIGDSVLCLVHLFRRGAAPTCMKAADVNDDGSLDIGDPVASLAYLFGRQSPPPKPFPLCGFESTPDALTCDSYLPCD